MNNEDFIPRDEFPIVEGMTAQQMATFLASLAAMQENIATAYGVPVMLPRTIVQPGPVLPQVVYQDQREPVIIQGVPLRPVWQQSVIQCSQSHERPSSSIPSRFWDQLTGVAVLAVILAFIGFLVYVA